MLQQPFADLLGIRYLTATRECVTAELDVKDELCGRPAVLHGGAIMSLADTLGACATALNLPEGTGTTTIESKTNFIAPAGGNESACGMHAAASGEADNGVADSDHFPRGSPGSRRDADADGASADLNTAAGNRPGGLFY
jgi:uncharacterized protein (TIGR00369 family)